MRQPCHFQRSKRPTVLSEAFGNTDIYLFMIYIYQIKHRLRAGPRFLIGFVGTEDEDEA